ncbi:MAG: MBL fold metallo-hydrolase [Myxococcota bacterium]
MLTTVKAGDYTIRGLSVGGVYTSLYVKELDSVLDVGLAPRSFGAAERIFLSHGHADHVGALTTLLGMRALMGKHTPPRLFVPEEIADPLYEGLLAMSRLQRYDLTVELQPMKPGQEETIRPDMMVRAFRTHHPVPSVGYQFFRRVSKLREEFKTLPGAEIGKLRKTGADIFDVEDRLELAYATDTLIRVLDTAPDIKRSKVLILECTFLDERKSLEASRRGCHIHLDELVERVGELENEALVLMHFSQIYDPEEVVRILHARLPEDLVERLVPFVPKHNRWPG